MIVVSDIRSRLEATDQEIIDLAVSRLKIARSTVRSAAVSRASFDARHGTVVRACSVNIVLSSPSLEREAVARSNSAAVKEKSVFEVKHGAAKLNERPVVAGFGPAGMFAALLLAEAGFRPIVLERGGDVASRSRAVKAYFGGGKLDETTNIQFGEGGAGTFSDGKLTTRIGDPLCEYLLSRFVEFGAPKDILVNAKPHIGTDRLVSVVKNIRERIISLGGEVRFCTKLTSFEQSGGRVTAALTDGGAVPTSVLVLAPGHSARDTFHMLHSAGVSLCAKGFAVGARIEHRQSFVDKAMYGTFAGHPLLPSASYNLAARSTKIPAYTFCMCPGGTVVAAASQNGGILTNGMSTFAQNGEYANSAIAVGVQPADFDFDPFKMIEFQSAIEAKAFDAFAGGCAPASSVRCFMQKKAGFEGTDILGSYPRGVAEFDLDRVLPAFVCDNMRLAIGEFERRMAGFAGNALLTGPETRTSSPVRILRGDSRQSESVAGLYPCGEGAGYAGGIMSAAVDGAKTAAAIIGEYYL